MITPQGFDPGPVAVAAIVGAAPGLAARIRKLALAGVAAAAVAFPPASGTALELGLTPDRVFSIWTNVNDALVTLARVVSDDQAWLDRLGSMKPEAYDGKTPKDVLRRVGEFREKLDQLRHGSRLGVTNQFRVSRDRVTHNDVFLNSGYALNGLVEWLIVNTGPKQLVSQFYTRYQFRGKTPNDVLGLVDLACRRIDEIEARVAEGKVAGRKVADGKPPP